MSRGRVALGEVPWGLGPLQTPTSIPWGGVLPRHGSRRRPPRSFRQLTEPGAGRDGGSGQSGRGGRCGQPAAGIFLRVPHTSFHFVGRFSCSFLSSHLLPISERVMQVCLPGGSSAGGTLFGLCWLVRALL